MANRRILGVKILNTACNVMYLKGLEKSSPSVSAGTYQRETFRNHPISPNDKLPKVPVLLPTKQNPSYPFSSIFDEADQLDDVIVTKLA